MYLFAQYFLFRRGVKPDWALENLVDIYRDVGIWKRCFCSRLKNIGPEDECVNAVIILDCLAKSVVLSAESVDDPGDRGFLQRKFLIELLASIRAEVLPLDKPWLINRRLFLGATDRRSNPLFRMAQRE